MKKIRLGRTGMMVSQIGLGGAPLQRPSAEDAHKLISKCLDLGINFIDTAAEYSDSEIKIGRAIKGRRDGVIISTKSNLGTPQEVEKNLQQSLNQLDVQFIDLFQLHSVNNLEAYAAATDPAGPIAVIRKAMADGRVKHMGMTTHSLEVARDAAMSGIFETVMYPFNFIVNEAEKELLPLTKRHDVGFIAMKPFAAGMIPQVKIAIKYLLQFPDIMTIPGFQKIEEVEEIVEMAAGPVQFTSEEFHEVSRIRKEQGHRLCRRCAKCEPCERGVQIVHIMDTIPLLKNFPGSFTFSDMISDNLAQVADCNNCGECEKRCIYGLPVIDLIHEYEAIYTAEKKKYLDGKS
ncbi:MAG: hypothetical protein A2Z02_07110 [Chloroflexi bacterium RBG_16_48_7]|nr:MAG: hypothetical protein A2Z02_07110 [Chloroflexi bacterium RBG_16_48_7]